MQGHRVADTPEIVLAGVSRSAICGVRDHNRSLVEGFRSIGVDVGVVWGELADVRGAFGTSAALEAWAGEVGESSRGADGLVVHFSVFSHAWRGLPAGTAALARALRGAHCPVVLYLHEPAYHWGATPRALAWATSQRVALRRLVTAASSLAVTTEPRVAWVTSRRWLPRRPVALVPVSSTLPHVSGSPPGTGLTIALLGHGSPASRPDIVVAGIERLRSEGVDVRTVFIGAPAADSAAGKGWRRQFERAGLESSARWTGVAEPAELAVALAGSHVALFTDPGGPSGRRTSVAAALALGVPVVGFDGPELWRAMVDDAGVTAVPCDDRALSDALRALMEPENRAERAAAARRFYDARLRPEIACAELLELLDVPVPSARSVT